MDAPIRGFMSELGVSGVLITLIVQFVLSSVLIWFVTNHMMNLGEKTRFSRCALCTGYLWVVQVVALVCAACIPFVGFIVGLFVWYKGSMASIEASIEIQSGTLTVYLLFIGTSAAVSLVTRAMMA